MHKNGGCTMVVKCRRCGATAKVPFTEKDAFIWVCDKCVTRHEHKPQESLDEETEELNDEM